MSTDRGYNVAGSTSPGTYYNPKAKRNAAQQRAYRRRMIARAIVDGVVLVLGTITVIGAVILLGSI